MRKWWLTLSFLLTPTIVSGQASYTVVTIPYKADNLNFFTGNGSTLFNVTLTGNVNTSGLNGGSLGMEVIFNICQDNIGGRTFNWPPNVVSPPTINLPANACTTTRFVNIGNFTWTNTGVATGIATAFPGGSPIQTQVNNGGVFGGTPCENFNNLSTGPENVDCDWHAKGPNPWIDITRFGARTCNVNATPCAVGLTANITSGTNTATISSASTFIKGDGVVIYGAGTATTLMVPTGLAVTNVLSQMGTGTGLTTASAAGSTTKCYKIIARTTGGGYTAASAETCTATGQPTLGAVTINLTSCSRATSTVTCTTSSAHPIVIGGQANQPEIYVGGSISDSSFRGWRTANASDSTHFSYNDTATNTGNGASTSSTGGTVTVYVANHLSWTAVTGAWLYYIYGGASGAETLIGVSRPQNGAIGVTDTTFDDFGPGLMSNISFPPWIPTTPPNVGANDNLSTTITSGAGTTTLTLFNNAGATVSGATIRLDTTPALIAAATASSVGPLGGAPIYVPYDPSLNRFQISSYCDLRPFGALSVIYSGTIHALETVAVKGSGLRWMGDRNTAMTVPGGGGANAWGAYPKFWVREAIPGLYADSAGGHSVEGVSFQSVVSNGVLLMLVEGGFNVNYKDVQWTTGTTSSDLIGFGLYLRGTAGQSAAGIIMDKVSFSTGLSADGASHATPFYCSSCGDTRIRESYITQSGIIFNGNAAGANLVIEDSHYNGGFTPLVSESGTVVTIGEPGKPVIMDTVGHPCVTAYFSTFPVYNNGCTPSGYIFQAPSVTGIVPFVGGNDNNLSVFNDSLFGPNTAGGQDGPSSTNRVMLNVTGPGGISVGYNKDSIFVQSPPPAAPTCSISAGGTVPVGTWTFKTVPLWWNNGQGNPSLASAGCTTSPGNQTITINWTIPPGFPQGMGVYTSNGGGYAQCAQCSASFPVTTTSVVWSTPTLGTLLSSFPLGGATSLLPDIQGISTPTLRLTGSVLTGLAPGGVVATGYQNSAYDNFNRANGAIGSNWTVSAGAFNVSSNTVVGAAGGPNVASWTATAAFFSDQFSQATVVTNGGGGVAVRASLTAATGYVYWVDGGNREIGRYVAGVFTSLNTVAGAFTTGDVIRLEIVGSSLTAFRNGAVDLTVSNATITSGQPGLIGIGATAAFDNWSGGNLHPIAQLDTEQDWTQPQHFTQPVTIGPTNPVAGALTSGALYTQTVVTNGGVPTCAATGTGTGATCGTLQTNSDDESGAFTISTGTTPAATGTFTLTFNNSTGGFKYCIFGPANTGLANWNARASFIVTAVGGSNNQAAWDNNAVNLTGSTTYVVQYVCGRH